MSKTNDSRHLNAEPTIAPKAFAFSADNKDILRRSSSGGAFYFLASYIIRLGGVVFGARMGFNGRVVHDMAETLDEIRPLMKSKYVQSTIGLTFLQCKQALIAGKWVLFSGTPCQINALLTFLDTQGVDRKKLISVDVVCHGTPRSWIWERYLREIGYTHGKEIDFRHKRPSWDSYSLKIGKDVFRINEDPYFWLFLNNYSLAESCFSCKCKGEDRRSDVTLGDFWGIKNVDAGSYNKGGTSLIVVRRRLDLIYEILGSCLKPVPYALSIFENSSYYLSVNKPARYDEFYELLKSNTVEGSAKKLGMSARSPRWYSSVRGRLAYRTIRPRILRNASRTKAQKGVVGIISDFGYFNFGNKLQNYALKTIIEKKFGKRCVNIVFSDYLQAKETMLHRAYRLLRHPKTFFRVKTSQEKRISAIKKTSKKFERNIKFHRTRCSEERLLKLECIVFGSDQIWNYGYHTEDLAFNLGFLGIDPMPVPLYTYAASIGKESIDSYVRPLFEEGLRHFKRISVRERSTADMLQREFGFDAQLCVDPTLLLSEQEWEEAIATYSSRKVPDSPYALIYIFEEEEHRKEIKDQLDKRGLKYIDLFDPRDHYFVSNQFDFINLIAHASELHTNSFHGIVFSLIFQVPFCSYSRQAFSEANSRIDTLLSYAIACDMNSEKRCYTLRDSPTFLNARNESFAYLSSIISPMGDSL